MITVDQERDKVIDRSVRFFNEVAATRFVHMRSAHDEIRRRDRRAK